MTLTTKGNEGQCARIGCNKIGHLSQRIGSSMFCYRMLVCDEHEKELNKSVW